MKILFLPLCILLLTTISNAQKPFKVFKRNDVTIAVYRLNTGFWRLGASFGKDIEQLPVVIDVRFKSITELKTILWEIDSATPNSVKYYNTSLKQNEYHLVVSASHYFIDEVPPEEVVVDTHLRNGAICSDGLPSQILLFWKDSSTILYKSFPLLLPTHSDIIFATNGSTYDQSLLNRPLGLYIENGEILCSINKTTVYEAAKYSQRLFDVTTDGSAVIIHVLKYQNNRIKYSVQAGSILI